jgi:IS4 transposase
MADNTEEILAEARRVSNLEDFNGQNVASLLDDVIDLIQDLKVEVKFEHNLAEYATRTARRLEVELEEAKIDADQARLDARKAKVEAKRAILALESPAIDPAERKL